MKSSFVDTRTVKLFSGGEVVIGGAAKVVAFADAESHKHSSVLAIAKSFFDQTELDFRVETEKAIIAFAVADCDNNSCSYCSHQI